MIQFGCAPLVFHHLCSKSGSSSEPLGAFLPDAYLPYSQWPQWCEMAIVPGTTAGVTLAMVSSAPTLDLTLIRSPSPMPSLSALAGLIQAGLSWKISLSHLQLALREWICTATL